MQQRSRIFSIFLDDALNDFVRRAGAGEVCAKTFLEVLSAPTVGSFGTGNNIYKYILVWFPASGRLVQSPAWLTDRTGRKSMFFILTECSVHGAAAPEGTLQYAFKEPAVQVKCALYCMTVSTPQSPLHGALSLLFSVKWMWHLTGWHSLLVLHLRRSIKSVWTL